MHIQRVINSKYEYRNTKQIQISNVQMIVEPRSPDKPGSSTIDRVKATGNAFAMPVQT